MPSKTDNLLKSMKQQIEYKVPIASEMFIPNLSGDHSAGIVLTTPTTDTDIANKKYVDDKIAALALPLSHTNALEITDVGTNTHAQIDTAITASTNHIADNTQAHSDYLLNDQADTGVGLTLTADNSSADTAYVPMVLYNTDATPPTASNFPIGTLYVQYTA